MEGECVHGGEVGVFVCVCVCVLRVIVVRSERLDGGGADDGDVSDQKQEAVCCEGFEGYRMSLRM